MPGERLDEQTMAIRAAKEFQEGMIINLGVGMPTFCSNFVPPDIEILFHSENGVLGFGPIIDNPDEADIHLINAGVQPVAPKPGMAFMDHAESLCIIRGGHVDITILGALQVSEKGDLANYTIPGKQIGSLGGGQDLAFCAKKVIALMTISTKEGEPKIVKECTSPLTAPACIDQIITDVGVLDVTPEGLVLREIVPGWTPEEVQALTPVKLIVPPDLKEMTLL
jgi:3-oxoacid CoA-transferase B subunit